MARRLGLPEAGGLAGRLSHHSPHSSCLTAKPALARQCKQIQMLFANKYKYSIKQIQILIENLVLSSYMQYLSLQFSSSTNHLLMFITALPFRLRLEGFRARSLRCVCQMRPSSSSSPSSSTSSSSSPDRGDSEKCLPDGIVRQSQTESSAPLDGIAPRAPQTHFCSERSSLVASHRWNLFTCFLGWICNHDWSERC